MTRMIDEQLSALLDGELPAEQQVLLLRRLEREPETRDKLARYGLIGELVRDASAQTSGLAISERVAAAIAPETTSSEFGSLPSASSSSGLGLAGAGIAAAIALVVMFNLTDTGSASRTRGMNVTAGTALSAPDADMQLAGNAARLTRYLVSHAQYSNSASRQLADSHFAMAGVQPASWSRHE